MERGLVAAVALFSFLLVGVALQLRAQDKGKTQKPYEVTVQVQPSATKGVFDCTVVVKDVKTGKQVFAPKLEVKIDDQSQASTINRDDLTLTCTVAVDKAGKEATYTFVAEQGEQKIQKDEGKVAIK